ncbi:MAG: Hint domain-containing protein, partial [Rhodospirillales bacterium]|nr:Hint domain-containing protein [Rhodospirillales bacterium]
NLPNDPNSSGSTFANPNIKRDVNGSSYDQNTALTANYGQWSVESASTACFASGTRIATEAGEIPVESLAVGDIVLARGLGLTPVVWLGHRTVDCRRHPRPHDVWPIRIRAGAFARGAPRRDLVLSPDHAVFVRGVLIPVRYLVNGATIVQEPREEITYWHVELAQHDLLLAEELACESYLDTGNRAAFANGGGAVTLHPDFAWQVWASRACAPLVLDGPERTAARRRLLARAAQLGHVVTKDANVHLLADGVPVPGCAQAGPLHRFKVGGRVKELRIMSRSGVPAELHADGTDHRRLGVMIDRIAFFRRFRWHGLALADIPTGRGFHRLEEEGARSWRWTDGDALLPIPDECARDGILHVELLIGATANYWLPAPAAAGAASGGAPEKRARS